MSASLFMAMALALPAGAPASQSEWSAGPMIVEVNRNVRPPQRLMIASDTMLAPGFSASVVGNPEQQPLRLMRPLAEGSIPRGRDALVLIARGNAGPVRISLATHDYDLVLDPEWRRYEIPLADLRPREGASASDRSLAIATALPAAQTASITVGFVGLGELGPRIRRVESTATGARVYLYGSARSDRQINVATDAAIATIHVTSNIIDVGDPIAGKVWLCHRHESATVCDPPDAPHTHYLRPPRPNEPLVIADFDTAALVTSAREPMRWFASSEQLQATFSQSDGALRIAMPIAAPSEHAGIELPLPALPQHAKTLELRLRGDASTGAVGISLADRTGKSTRLDLRAYVAELGPDWRAISIPMTAFRAALSREKFGDPKKLTITISGRAGAGTLEIDLIRFRPGPSPISLAGFDLSLAHTDLAGDIAYESSSGEIEGTIDPEGRSGRALRIRVRDIPADGYARASLGLGRLDAREGHSIFLSARSDREGRIALWLSDGSKKARFDDLGIGSDWRTIELSLDAAKKQGVRIDRLSTLLLVWEGRAVAEEMVMIDDVRAE